MESLEGISQRQSQNTPLKGCAGSCGRGAIRVQFACVFQGGPWMVLGGVRPSQNAYVSDAEEGEHSGHRVSAGGFWRL